MNSENQKREEDVRKIADAVSKQLALEGRIVEGGWRALYLVDRLDRVNPIQQNEMRRAYFHGAQHLFATLLNVLQEGTEATDQDVSIMQKLHAELQKFVEECLAQKGN